MKMKFHTTTEDQTIALGEKIGSLLKGGEVLAMRGTLGAGKTTITKGIAKSLGIDETITSPTFCLISEYSGKKLDLYHMDVYRLEGAEDFENLGTDEMLYGNGVSIIEWSEKISSVLPKKSITIELIPHENGERDIIIENWPHEEIDFS